jgi:hypothetical protein
MGKKRQEEGSDQATGLVRSDTSMRRYTFLSIVLLAGALASRGSLDASSVVPIQLSHLGSVSLDVDVGQLTFSGFSEARVAAFRSTLQDHLASTAKAISAAVDPTSKVALRVVVKADTPARPPLVAVRIDVLLETEVQYLEAIPIAGVLWSSGDVLLIERENFEGICNDEISATLRELAAKVQQAREYRRPS